jgi:hypothetical protein
MTMLHGLFAAGAARDIARATQARLSSESASHATDDVRRQCDALGFDIEKLFMVTEALWEILKRHHGHSDDELVEMIEQIDLRDGKLDGKVARTAERPSCPACGRTIMRKQVRCLYCGAAAPTKPFGR